MNLRHYPVAVLFTVTTFVPLYAQTVRQNPHPAEYTPALKRVLAVGTANFLYTASQGQIDMDSAVVLSTHIYQINPLLPYNETFAQDTESRGEKLIAAGKIKDAIALAQTSQNEDKLRLLAELATYFLHRPGIKTAHLDSASYFIDQLDKTSSSLKQQQWNMEGKHLRAKLCFQQGKYPESQKHLADIVDFYRTQKKEVLLAHALLNQARHLPFGAPPKLPLLQESLTLFEKNNVLATQILVLAEMIMEHFRTDLPEAERKLKHILDIQKQIGFWHSQDVHNVLSYISLIKSDYVNALYHAEQSIKYMKETGDVALAAFYYSRVGTIYSVFGNLQEALVWNEKALQDRNHLPTIFWYKSFLDRVHWLAGNNGPKEAMKLIQEITKDFPPVSMFDQMHVAILTGTCYRLLGNVQQADVYYSRFLDISSRFPPEHLHAEFPEALSNAGLFYFQYGKHDVAKAVAERIQKIPTSRQGTHALENLYLLRFKLDSAQGNYTAAINHYAQYKHFADSTRSLSQRKKIDELTYKYQAETKDQSIKLLTEQNKRADVIRNITFAGTGMLLVIVGLLYIRYRDKQRTNVQLQTQQDQITIKNNELQHLVREKEWLLREIHHRVKNNLQMVMSLLGSQAAYLDKDALAAIQDGQHRVYSMSLIHQKLYNTEDLTSLDISIYLHELVKYLKESFKEGTNIVFKLDIDPIELDVTQAIPLGLIVNEVVTNSLKHAFPGNRPGTITIVLTCTDDKINLVMEDDGIGIAQETTTSSFGMKLITGLTRELDGTLMITNTKGMCVSISFVRERIYYKKNIGMEAAV
jgi:two-component sensor histidine kinase